MTSTQLSRYSALLFDLDGVVTRTATIHAAAWKRLFDAFLGQRGREDGRTYSPFDIATDYPLHVDGRRRYEGVDGFLRSRGIELPWGAPSDPPGTATVCALGNAKNRYFEAQLGRHEVEVFDDAVALIREGRARGLRLAVVSASENCRAILERAGLLGQFDAAVTGVEAAALGLPGKPAPDTFLEAARRLQVRPADAVVLEDAIAGVEAGRAGGFGLVVGVDRGGAGTALRAAGAHVVTGDLTQLLTGG
jgi:beta-phosphoglucomutase family hydrolase